MLTHQQRIVSYCRGHRRELAFAGVLLLAVVAAIAVGIRLHSGREISHGAAPRETSGQFGEHNLPYIVVEDSVTGESIQRERQRPDDFKRWTRYKVVDSYELSGRLVAGLKESKSIVIRVQPQSLLLPNIDQLQEISERHRSREHHSTYVHFFLPGMDYNQSPWSTVFQQSNRPTSVSFDKSHVPALYRRFEETAWK